MCENWSSLLLQKYVFFVAKKGEKGTDTGGISNAIMETSILYQCPERLHTSRPTWRETLYNSRMQPYILFGVFPNIFLCIYRLVLHQMTYSYCMCNHSFNNVHLFLPMSIHHILWEMCFMMLIVMVRIRWARIISYCVCITHYTTPGFGIERSKLHGIHCYSFFFPQFFFSSFHKFTKG